jgi:hypothetical protein
MSVAFGGQPQEEPEPHIELPGGPWHRTVRATTPHSIKLAPILSDACPHTVITTRQAHAKLGEAEAG